MSRVLCASAAAAATAWFGDRYRNGSGESGAVALDELRDNEGVIVKSGREEGSQVE